MISFILKLLFGNTDPDFTSGREPVIRRFPSKTDPARDRTVIVVAGPLDARRLAGALKILKGTHHARRRVGKKKRQEELADGYIPIGRRMESR